jgi:hypothetical protein
VEDVTVMIAFGLVHVGCMIETRGAEGIPVTASITTLAVAAELQPSALVTMKLRMPGERFPIVVLVPEPAIFPGFNIQLPTGKPLKITEPDGEIQVG